MGRVYNFSAGPAVLPEEVLRQAAAEMLAYDGTGIMIEYTETRQVPGFFELCFTSQRNRPARATDQTG